MEFKTASGADVVINIAPFRDAMNLKNIIGKELSKSGFDFKNMSIETDFSELIPLIISIDCSDDVHKAIMKCLEKSLYKGFKINENLFDEEEGARDDYYEIIIECLKVNLTPFFKGLTSRLKSLK